MPNEISQAITQICEEKGISLDSVIETIEAALAVAYRKDFGEKGQNIQVEFDMETGQSRVFDGKTVVEAPPPEEMEEVLKEEDKKEEKKGDKSRGKKKEEEAVATKKDKKESESAKGEEWPEEEKKRFNPKTDIILEEAKKIKKGAKIDDEIRTELFPPEAYGRMAAQTAKQVIVQKLREAEREVLYNEYKGQEGSIVTGVIQRQEGRLVLIDVGKVTALMPPQEQVEEEQYNPGQKIKIYVISVEKTSKGPEIIVSRSHPEMIKQLFELEVPEVASGAIEIKSVSREAGSRAKVAVMSNQENIDPIGSCVGQRGSRVQTIIAELGGEKIDIIEWSDDPVKFIINSLSPAKVLNVKLSEDRREAFAEVKEDQLSLAIGKAGQNVRLSAKLTGWKIDIVKERESKDKAEDKDKDKDKDNKIKEKPKKLDKEEKENQESPSAGSGQAKKQESRVGKKKDDKSKKESKAEEKKASKKDTKEKKDK